MPEPLHCTFFHGARDNRGRAWSGTWPELRDRLERTYRPAPDTTGDEAKKSLWAISGTRFKGPRCCMNAVDVHLLILDFDNSMEIETGEFWPDKKTGEPTRRPRMQKVMIPNPVTMAEIQEALRDAGVNAYLWSTWSHRAGTEDEAGWPKFRVVIPLAHPIPAPLWPAAAERAIKRLGLESFRRGLDVPVMRDVARLNFLPAAPDPSTIKRAETAGNHLAIPLDELKPAEVEPLPLHAWQKATHAERKAAREAGEHWFQAYRVGGRPVDFKALDLAALLASHGVKVGNPKPHGGGVKFRCHCPWSHEHSGGMDDDCCVVIQTPGQWPSFACAHSHHAHLGLQDVIEWAWGRA
jgi:hypothetical protein